MTDPELIRQIETALDALKAGDESALDRLFALIKVGNIEHSQGIAIGQNIRQVVIVHGQGFSQQLTARIEQILELLSKVIESPQPESPALRLSDFEPVGTDQRVSRHAAAHSVFISYSRADTLAVNPIARRLSRDHYYDVWIDYDSIPLGENWKAQIARGIAGAERVLFMASPSSLASPACREEIRFACEHGKRIIPIRLTSALEWEDLTPLALHERQGLDFSAGETDAVWEKLLANLPPLLARDRRRLEPEFQTLHARYLRSLFRRYGRVNLTYLLDAAPVEAVNLLDMYVPLKLNVSFSVDVVDGKYADWWLRLQDEEPQDITDEIQERNHRPKALAGFEPQGKALASWEEMLARGWEDFKSNHQTTEAKKPEHLRRPLEDGTYRWKRIESETAPALQPHLVITGDPGSGKTTLMRHLALCMAGDMLSEPDDPTLAGASLDRLGFWPWPAYTPVFVELRELVSKAFPSETDPVTLKRFLDYLKDEQLCPDTLEPYLDHLVSQMEHGEAMLFLDGLDEISGADSKQRREQVKQLARLLRCSYPKCRILITSRPYAYAGDWPVEGFGTVTMAWLDDDRLEELAGRLFRVVLGQDEAEEQAAQFKSAMQRIPEELRRNPLFFTLLAAIWLNNRALPPPKRLPVSENGGDNRNPVYRECVDMLIRRWTFKDLSAGQQSVAEAIGIDRELLRDLLETLAYTVHCHGAGDKPTLFMSGEIMTVARGMGIKGLKYDLLLDTPVSAGGRNI